MNAWTDVPKPTGDGPAVRVGMTMGLMIPLTSAIDRHATDKWTRVNKPT